MCATRAEKNVSSGRQSNSTTVRGRGNQIMYWTHNSFTQVNGTWWVAVFGLLLVKERQCRVQNWKEWAYTDGSCQIHLGRQVIGAGVYHPDNDSPNYVQPNGTGITHTIVRAELAAIAAAILQGYSHIATNSLPSLH
eukprot:1142207-Pelagomonas_calceolata.AAC.2